MLTPAMIEAGNEILSPARRELWVLTAAADGRRGGLVASFVSAVSIVAAMPRILVALAVRHHTTGLVRNSSAFVLHQIGEEQIDWVWHFGLRSGRDADKLQDFALREGRSGAPILTAAPAWLECEVENTMETGDRTVFLAAVIAAAVTRRDVPPLTFARLRELAPAARLARMDELFERDATIDAQHIALFRDRRP